MDSSTTNHSFSQPQAKEKSELSADVGGGGSVLNNFIKSPQTFSLNTSSPVKVKPNDSTGQSKSKHHSSSSNKHHNSSSSSEKVKHHHHHHSKDGSSKHHSSSKSKDGENKSVKTDQKKHLNNSLSKSKDNHVSSSSGSTKVKENNAHISSNEDKKPKENSSSTANSSPTVAKLKLKINNSTSSISSSSTVAKTNSTSSPSVNKGSLEKVKASTPNNATSKSVTGSSMEKSKIPDSSGGHKKEHKRDKDSKVKVKTETMVKEEPNVVSAKDEPVSDDEVPLAARIAPKVEIKEEPKHKAKKRPADSDSDEEPLSARISKAKVTKKMPAKKRKPAESSDDEPISKKMKKNANSNSKQKPKAGETPSPRKKKKEEEQEVWKWWEEEKYDSGIKWKTLEHKGPVFAPSYEPMPDDIHFLYDGKVMKLSPEAEEVATFYAKMLDHDYTTKDVFNKNFFKDWRKTMTKQEQEKITDLKKCDFRKMHQYFVKKNEERKAMTKEQKAEIKKENERLTQEYGFCIIDGHRERIGNFKIEPPGLFRGRGEHPKMGMLKKRTMPRDVIINCSKGENQPKPPEGYKWKEVRHDNTVTWLACWTENVQGQTKYVMLNASSKLKGEKDWSKYEIARKLRGCVDKIRENYLADFKSREMKVRQRATALYFIDKLALRAGNEKEDGETADTVGCCSLRVEHINLCEEKDGQQYVVEFDFLGKDSIRYQNSVPVEKRVYKNLQHFMDNKQPDDDLFDRLNTASLNKHLNELMPGLTAKVFRTYNASITLQQQLDLLTKANDSIPEKILAYNRANRAVAILCNHQRSVPKTFSKSMENLQGKIAAKREQVAEAEKELKKVKKDKGKSERDKILLDKKKKAVERLKEQLTKLEVQATDKEENKEIALGTSKLNYLDPRISVAWCKKWNIPIEKVYNKTQREKFRWAIEMAGPDFVF